MNSKGRFQMKILWLTWKDKKNPLAGGAEVVASELGKRLALDGHEVLFLVGGFEGAEKEEIINGCKVIRVGGRWTVYWEAFKYYKKNLRGWADMVVDEMNTIPFFTKLYVKERKIMFIHQLCREIWFYQMFFPLNIIGFVLEFFYLRMLNDQKVITVSESTKKDLMRFGFEEKNINIISEGIEIDPIKEIEIDTPVILSMPEVETQSWSEKYPNPTLLSFGAVRAMKRTDQIIKAFELIKSGKNELLTPSYAIGHAFDLTNFKLIIAGDINDKFGEKILQMIEKSPFKDSIDVLGRVSIEKKIELMQKSHVLAVTSIKEGWGLVVTEANSQGTPAVVYDVDGLRDSVRHNETGLICQKNSPESLAKNIERLLKKGGKYEKIRNTAWKWSKKINFEKSYGEFIKFIKLEKYEN